MDETLVQFRNPIQSNLATALSINLGSDSGPCVEVTIPTDQVMQKEGSSVELCCHYKTSVSKNFILEWRFAPLSTAPEMGKQILYFTNNMLYKPGSQASRLSLLQSPPTTGDATIRLDNVRTSDAGTYICEVNNPPDFYGSGSGLIHFTVLMPPSTPVCKGTEYASVGSDATLTCNSAEGTPTPVYAWSHIGSKTPLPLVNMVQDEKTGTLMLTNLSQAFSGTYQCVASNEFGHASCQVTINVTGTAKAGVIVGAVIGVFLAFFLFTVIILYTLQYRKRNKKDSQSTYTGNELREDATAPGITETSLQRRDSDPGNRFLERPSSQAESMSTTKSRLNIVV
ncbi:PREDICTED: V-set and immunoglobulin domain-containing protein 2 [Crocodylus porosus]|uniref:V-set and immunoglobulin domain-containing protein 2 n=1 Tax=Crocodylus porosus TaxID=8502 RepID=UPI00093A380D|nr:PREDICTED: V-set and immunoglobulin domain-containing protein 2 [Crocodylus porosus]